MNKKILAIAGGVAVVACCLGWYGFKTAERNTETAVLQTLRTFGVNCEDADYSFFSKKLTLSKLAYDITLAGFEVQGTIDSAEITGFNPNCLDPKEQGLPKVADLINCNGISVDSKYFVTSGKSRVQMTGAGTIQQMRISDWYQNLGALTQAYQQGINSEAFWTEVYKHWIGGMSYTNYAITQHLPKDGGVMKYSFGAINMLGNTGSKDGNPNSGRLISVAADDMRMTMPGIEEMTADRFEIHDFLLPSPKGMAELFEMMPKIIVLAEDPMGIYPGDPLVQGLMAWLINEYSKQTMFSRVLFNNYIANYDESVGLGTVSMQLLEMTMRLDEFVNFGLNIEKLDGFTSQLPEDARNLLTAYAPENQTLDLNLSFALRHNHDGASKVSLNMGFADLGRADLVADILLDLESFTDVFDPMFSGPEIPLLESFGSTYKDNGFLAFMINLYALDAGISVNRAIAALREDLNEAPRELGQLGMEIMKAGSIMLDKPGTVNLKLVLEEPVEVSTLMMMFLLGGEDIKLEINALPGEKPLLDYVPETPRSSQRNSRKPVN